MSGIAAITLAVLRTPLFAQLAKESHQKGHGPPLHDSLYRPRNINADTRTVHPNLYSQGVQIEVDMKNRSNIPAVTVVRNALNTKLRISKGWNLFVLPFLRTQVRESLLRILVWESLPLSLLGMLNWESLLTLIFEFLILPFRTGHCH